MVKLSVDKEVMLGSINNLKGFNAENKLRHATLTFMATQLSSKKEQQQLRDSFNQFDKNGDGKIELAEFIEAYKIVYPHLDVEDLEKEARDIFAAADADGNGFLDYGEFTTATINQRDLLNSQNI